MSFLVKTTGAVLFFFSVFLCVKGHLYANVNPVSFSAIITDSLSGKAAGGATVVLPELKKSFSSNENGLVIMDSLTALPSFMLVTADGYAPQRVSLTNVTQSAPFQVKLVQTTSTDTTSTDTSVSASFQNSEEPVKPVVSEFRPISGRVVDRKTGLPLPDAVVSVAASKEAVISDRDGKFSIHIPAAAPCSITVVKSDYKRLTIPSDSLDSGEVAKIALTQLPVSKLKDMVVRAERVKQLIKTSDKIGQIKMSPEIVSKLPGAGQDDLFRALQFLPGVNSSNETSAALFVRGGTPDQNLVLLDQVPIYYVDHFYGFFSTFNPHAIGDVTLYRGGFGARWGGRLSSVVDLVSSGMNASDTGGIKAGIGTGLLSSDAYLQIPINKNKTGTLMFAARRAMTDITQTNLFSSIFKRMHGNDTAYSDGSRKPSYKEVFADGSYTSFPIMKGYRLVYQPKYYFWDLNGLAAFRLGNRGRLATTFFASRDYQDNSLDTSYSEKTIRAIWLYDIFRNISYFSRYDTVTSFTKIRSKNPLIWGNLCGGQEWEQQWSDVFKSKLILSYSQYLDTKEEDYYRRDSVSVHFSDSAAPFDTTAGVTAGTNSRNKIVDISGKLDNSFRLSDWNMLNVGAELSWKSVIYDRDTVSVPGLASGSDEAIALLTRPVHTHDTGVSYSFYAEDEMTFGDKAGLTPGVRYYYFRHSSAHAVDPRLSLWYRLLTGLTIKGACGIYTQEIHRAEEEDISGGSKFVWLLSNKNRPLEKSKQVLAGLSWEKAHFLFDVEGYIKRVSGLKTISERMRSGINTIPGLAVTLNQDEIIKQKAFDPDQFALFEGTGLARGIDLLIQIKNARFPLFKKSAIYDGWVAYTLSRSENTYSVFNDGKPFPATNDHTHEFKIVNSLEWNVSSWSSIGLGAVWMYSTGKPYTAAIEKYDLIYLIGSNRSYTYVSDKNACRLPDYHRLDTSTAWKVHIGSHIQCSLTLGLFNVYNRENILERTYTASNVSNFSPLSFVYNNTFTGEDYKTVITAIDQKAMSVMPNAALKVTATF